MESYSRLVSCQERAPQRVRPEFLGTTTVQPFDPLYPRACVKEVRSLFTSARTGPRTAARPITLQTRVAVRALDARRREFHTCRERGNFRLTETGDTTKQKGQRTDQNDPTSGPPRFLFASPSRAIETLDVSTPPTMGWKAPRPRSGSPRPPPTARDGHTLQSDLVRVPISASKTTKILSFSSPSPFPSGEFSSI